MDPNIICANSILSNELFWNFISAVIGALLGGGLAILGSWLANSQAHKNELKTRQIEQQDQLKGFYQALKTEINVLWERYMWGMGNRVEQIVEGQYIDIYYPVTQEYFVNYKTNAHLIGQIPEQQLKEMIVMIYIKAQGLIDSYRLNNHFNEQHDHWRWMSAETNNPLHIQHAQAMEHCLIEYATPIKELHYELKDSIPKLIGLLENNILELSKTAK